MTHIAMSRQVWDEARKHLLGTDRERFGFFLASVVPTADGPRFCVLEFIAIPDDRTDAGWRAERSITLEVLLEVLNRARREKLTLIECHTHPGAERGVQFSYIDDDGMEETAAYVLESLAQPYAALVFGQDSVDARCWQLGQRAESVDRITIASRTNEIVFPTSSPRKKMASLMEMRRYARQISLVEQAGQARIGSFTVGIVGLSGLGSHILQQLAYLGVRRLVLVDPDVIDESNLNRVVGAGPADVGKFKVEVLARVLKTVAPDAEVVTIAGDLRDEDSFEALAGVDAVVGCVDNDGARLVLNELARAYNLTLVDVSSGITARDGKFEEAGGRIAVVHPGGPCLLCMGEIDRKEAAFFLAPKDKQAEDRRRGYVDGWDAHAPSVVSLNGAVASMAVSEFFLAMTGLAPASLLTYYYLREPGSEMQRKGRRAVERSEKCYTCSLEGLGELAGTRRFGGGGEKVCLQ